MTLDAAEELGLRVLSWLAERGEIERFLGMSGLAAADLRKRAEDPRILGAVLSFLLADEALTSAFCTEEKVPAPGLHRAEHVLGETP